MTDAYDIVARATLASLVAGDPVPFDVLIQAFDEVPGDTQVPLTRLPEGMVKLDRDWPNLGGIEKIERWLDPVNAPKYGDIRDLLLTLPAGDIHGAASYAYVSDLFVVRFEIIRQLDPQPISVFEFGALYGYFLVTAYAACAPDRIGWCDNEQHTAGSNRMVAMNLAEVVDENDRPEIKFFTHRDQVLAEQERRRGDPPHYAHDPSLYYDLVSVDAGHSYDECLADLHAAHQLRPRWIMVDDWTAATHMAEVQSATRKFLETVGDDEYVLSEHVTANGLALLTAQARRG